MAQWQGRSRGTKRFKQRRWIQGLLLSLVLTPWRGIARDERVSPPDSNETSPTAARTSGIQLRRGEFYFRVDGTQALLLGRNVTGPTVEAFGKIFQSVRDSGERIARIHLDHGLPASKTAGRVDERWAAQWERVFDLAQSNGIHVLPVFSVWAEWNDGSRSEQWHNWNKNPYNAANGGPAKRPSDLFADTPCRKLWLSWLGSLAGRWQSRRNIVGWEIFSELNLVTGATEDAAAEFVRVAARTIRAADLHWRPITASLAGIKNWPKVFGIDALDFIQVHPYAEPSRFKGNLDEMILQSVRERLRRYGKPVFIGECGLDARGFRDTLADNPRVRIGIQHAIWASTVSGAMDGRMLWWEDGYGRFQRRDYYAQFDQVAAPVARFVEGVDFAGFRPIATTDSREILGGAIGNERLVLGWFRDARCAPPDWPVRRVEGQSVTLGIPGIEPQWNVEFCDTASSVSLGSLSVCREGRRLTIPLPPFQDSIAFKARSNPRLPRRRE